MSCKFIRTKFRTTIKVSCTLARYSSNLLADQWSRSRRETVQLFNLLEKSITQLRKSSKIVQISALQSIPTSDDSLSSKYSHRRLTNNKVKRGEAFLRWQLKRQTKLCRTSTRMISTGALFKHLSNSPLVTLTQSLLSFSPNERSNAQIKSRLKSLETLSFC